jgi:hypothetical protein
MITALLLAALAQAAPLPPAVWKERNRPDMPVLPPCELGAGTSVVDRLMALPVEVADGLSRFLGPKPMSDAGGPFNGTDVVGEGVPQRRFLRAYGTGRRWVIWYELGGMAGGPRTLALRREAARHGQPARYHAVPGTVLAGDLCAATRAIMAGVRSASS